MLYQSVFILAFATGGLFLINCLHWLWRRGDFSQSASNKYLRFASVAWTVTIGCVLLADRMHWVPTGTLMWFVMLWLSAQQLYSIWARETRRHKPPAVGTIEDSLPPGFDLATTSTWSPFQSAEVKEICRYLTLEEKRALMNQVLLFSRTGASPGLLIFLPLLVVVLFSFRHTIIGMLYIRVYWWPRLRRRQCRMRELLCATKYASDKGYRVDNLNLYSFPWSRRPSSTN
jgi:hypothetical protein